MSAWTSAFTPLKRGTLNSLTPLSVGDVTPSVLPLNGRGLPLESQMALMSYGQDEEEDASERRVLLCFVLVAPLGESGAGVAEGL